MSLPAPLPAQAVWQPLPPLPGADLAYAPSAVPQPEAWLDVLRAQIPWERHRLRLFGRELEAPRLSCWIGDADAVYTYSRTRFVPRPWIAALAALRDWLAALTGAPYNSVLCNLYRNGQDSMGWHSDDEPELGAAPTIASLSFGAVRRFRLRHRRDPALRLELELAPGSLLLMRGSTQALYRHDLPRTARPLGPRLNLTYRHVASRRSAGVA
jgi:alkylated DNA repair dioxygenase AlkB